jgi:molybdate transport system ATP-binding protein
MLLMEGFLSDKELLLLDEPFQFLDPLNKERVSTYIQSHLHKDTTLILITHYDEDVLQWTEKRMQL